MERGILWNLFGARGQPQTPSTDRRMSHVSPSTTPVAYPSNRPGPLFTLYTPGHRVDPSRLRSLVRRRVPNKCYIRTEEYLRADQAHQEIQRYLTPTPHLASDFLHSYHNIQTTHTHTRPKEHFSPNLPVCMQPSAANTYHHIPPSLHWSHYCNQK